MIWGLARKILDSLSVKALSQQFDKRRLQHEIDLHRLFLLLTFHRDLDGGIVKEHALLVEKISSAAKELDYQSLRAAVEDAVLTQVIDISSALEGILAADRQQAATEGQNYIVGTCKWIDANERAMCSPATPLRRSTNAPAVALLQLLSWEVGAAPLRAAGLLRPTRSNQRRSPRGLAVRMLVKGRGAASALSQLCFGASVNLTHPRSDLHVKKVSCKPHSPLPKTNVIVEEQRADGKQLLAPLVLAVSPGCESKAKGCCRPPGMVQSRMTMQQVGRLFKERLGYVLDLRPSRQAGGEAGTGLWLDGQAAMGRVVALYPGLTYGPMAYRRIPGYPRVDQDNEYLMARFDGVVLDAKPWGAGGQPASVDDKLGPGTSAARDAQAADDGSQLNGIETRHPLAFAHYANHPSVGAEPNVMVAAFDFQASGQMAGLRPFMPNRAVEADGSLLPAAGGAPIPGLALVAIRPLSDEEVLLNYRLSTHVARPSWYHAVDQDEDARRWA